MGFGHIYVKADAEKVAEAVEAHLAAKGFRRTSMSPERHPSRMKEIHEGQLRLFWMSPRLAGWTGLFEFRYYSNEVRARWGYTDEGLALALSALGETWRLEVLDGSRFWLYAKYAGGSEVEGKAYQDQYGERSPDRTHPRYALNDIIEREGFPHVGLGYEHIPGPDVAPIENVPMDGTGIEGLEKFRHFAFEPTPGAPKPEPEADHDHP
ncbi:MAG TPA: hypothetical protein VF950_11625 [Planctomycetota bacterium]